MSVYLTFFLLRGAAPPALPSPPRPFLRSPGMFTRSCRTDSIPGCSRFPPPASRGGKAKTALFFFFQPPDIAAKPPGSVGPLRRASPPRSPESAVPDAILFLFPVPARLPCCDPPYPWALRCAALRKVAVAIPEMERTAFNCRYRCSFVITPYYG